MTHRGLRFLPVTGIVLVLVALVPFPARAQDPVDRAAGIHLISVKGPVSVRHGEDGPWSRVAAGVFLADGDHLAVGPKGQAEIALDDAHVFQAAKNTEVRITEMLPGHYRLALLKGSIAWQVTAPSAALVEVETPSVAVRPSHKGDYSIALNRAGESEIVSRFGAVEVHAPAGSEWINTGQKMVARGPAGNPEYKIGPAVPRWKRIAVFAMNCMQIVAEIGDSLPAHEESTANSSSGKSNGASAPPAPPRERAPSTAPQHESGRGKG